MTGVVESELERVVTEGNSTATQDEAMTEGTLDVDTIEGTSVKSVLKQQWPCTNCVFQKVLCQPSMKKLESIQPLVLTL